MFGPRPTQVLGNEGLERTGLPDREERATLPLVIILTIVRATRSPFCNFDVQTYGSYNAMEHTITLRVMSIVPVSFRVDR